MVGAISFTLVTDSSFELILADFLMKYIIIGIYDFSTIKKLLAQRWLSQEKLEPGNRVCCITSPTTHVRPVHGLQAFCSPHPRQRPFTAYYRSRIFK